MVTAARNLDAVAQRLASAGDLQSASLLQWLEGQHQRRCMRRRATLCTLAGWGLMTTAAVVSSLVAVHMCNDLREIMPSGLWPADSDIPMRIRVLPWVLVSVAALLIVGGLWCWVCGRIPGFSRTVSAIDWAAASDAVTRLLSVGCNYPEAFRAAAEVTRTKPSRNWLIQAAERVEQGGPQVLPSSSSEGDAVVLESLIDAAQSQPHRQWQLAADHFIEVARRRLVLLLQATPMLATIISGLLIWFAISVTLGWMWRAVAEMCTGLT